MLLGLCNCDYDVCKVFWILRFITLAVIDCLMIFQRIHKINENPSTYVGFITDEHDLLKMFFLTGCGI